MTAWVFFIGATALGYVLLTIVSSTVGFESPSLRESFMRFIRPGIFTSMLLGNVLLVIAVYYGFIATSAAIPILISIGVLTSVLYSVLALGMTLTLAKVVGIAFVLIGIYLLK